MNNIIIHSGRLIYYQRVINGNIILKGGISGDICNILIGTITASIETTFRKSINRLKLVNSNPDYADAVGNRNPDTKE